MQIKKYVAPSLREASEQMKLELGSEAIILGTRTVAVKTEFGTKNLFEITGGIETGNPDSTLAELTVEENSADSFQSELKRISENFENQNKKIGKVKADSELLNTGTIKNSLVDLEKISDILFKNDVSKVNIKKIISLFKNNYELSASADPETALISALASLIPTAKFDVNKQNRPVKVALVGPTGVGKTTCIAKLAVISRILHNLNIGLISIDTYRLGALDQLKIFSDVSQIEMLVAYEPEDMPGLIRSFKKKDIIFIDTAGRSQKNLDHLLKTKSFIDKSEVDHTILVMSATSSSQNLYDVAERFDLFGYDSVIFTKIDEAVTFGNLLNVTSRYKIPAIFLTNGQVIPDDIFAADSEYIASMIYNGVNEDERTD